MLNPSSPQLVILHGCYSLFHMILSLSCLPITGPQLNSNWLSLSHPLDTRFPVFFWFRFSSWYRITTGLQWRISRTPRLKEAILPQSQRAHTAVKTTATGVCRNNSVVTFLHSSPLLQHLPRLHSSIPKANRFSSPSLVIALHLFSPVTELSLLCGRQAPNSPLLSTIYVTVCSSMVSGEDQGKRPSLPLGHNKTLTSVWQNKAAVWERAMCTELLTYS